MINQTSISVLRPCKDRFDNFVEHYSDRSFTPKQFMGLKNITHQDKMWVAFRSLSLKNIQKAAAEIAESVLHIYEKKYPIDKRPREVIEAARQYAKGEITIEKLREKQAAATAAYADATAVYAAAAAADADAAAAAAYAAYAVAAAAVDAYAAAAAAADADAAVAAYAAAAAAVAARRTAHSKQEKLIRTIILKYWKESA